MVRGVCWCTNTYLLSNATHSQEDSRFILYRQESLKSQHTENPSLTLHELYSLSHYWLRIFVIYSFINAHVDTKIISDIAGNRHASLHVHGSL